MFSIQDAKVTFTKKIEIGQEGKNSKVFLAHDANLDGQIVIKEINKSINLNFNPDAFFAEARKLFRSTHPYVVQICYACQDAEYVYIAMPFYKNGSMKGLILKRNLKVREVIKYATEFLSGLNNVHSKNLLHFDLKPDNILLSDRNEALISDFGLAQLVNSDGVATLDSWYSKIIPPEFIHGYKDGNLKFDRTYDIYQIGLTMYRMCVGEKYFEDQWKSLTSDQDLIDKLSNGSFPDRKAYPPHIPQPLQKVINKCLSVDPLKRYNSAIAIINAIADIDNAMLDWEYDVDAGRRSWTKLDARGNVLKLVIEADDTTIATKQTATKTTKISEFCSNGLSEAQIVSFLNK